MQRRTSRSEHDSWLSSLSVRAAMLLVSVPSSPLESLEQNTLDQLRDDDLDLYVPLPPGAPRPHRHVLERQLELDGQSAQLHHLSQSDAEWHRPDIAGRRLPVRQDVARVPDAPAIAEKHRCDGLEVELAR